MVGFYFFRNLVPKLRCTLTYFVKRQRYRTVDNATSIRDHFQCRRNSSHFNWRRKRHVNRLCRRMERMLCARTAHASAILLQIQSKAKGERHAWRRSHYAMKCS